MNIKKLGNMKNHFKDIRNLLLGLIFLVVGWLLAYKVHIDNTEGIEINLNGSVDSIAGICNETKNVFGLMPHPERVCESTLQGIDGVKMLSGFLDS